MMFEHLTIGQLSDFIDNSLSIEEKNLILEHIRNCEICRCEYESLKKCVILISGLRNEAYQLPDISERTLLICRSRERKRLYIKSIPAIAASIMIIAGAGFIQSEFYTKNNNAFVAANMPVQSETQVIINAIRDSNGRIMNMTPAYIDGEIDNSSLANLEKYLQKNNIKHTIVPVRYREEAVINRNITNTSLKSGNIAEPEGKKIQIIRSKESNKITVRFFK